MSVSDQEPLYKMSVLNFFGNRHFAATKFIVTAPLKCRTASVKGLAIHLLFQLVPHAPYTACFISVFVGLKMHRAAGEGHEGTNRL